MDYIHLATFIGATIVEIAAVVLSHFRDSNNNSVMVLSTLGVTGVQVAGKCTDFSMSFETFLTEIPKPAIRRS